MSDEDAIVLGGEQQAYADRAFIHYGKEGFYFEQPGTYRLRARYTAPDGSVVVSGTTTLRVQPPATAEDVEVADLLFGDEQGTLMYLVGSDFDELQRGNDALDTHLGGASRPPARERRPADPGRQRGAGVQGDPGGRYGHRPRARHRRGDRAARPGASTLDAVRKVGSKQKDELARTTAVARRLRTEIAPAQPDAALEGYIVARRREIAAEVGTALELTDPDQGEAALAAPPQSRCGRLGQWRR